MEPKFKVRARPSQPDAFAGKLTAWLRVKTSKPRKQRRTAKQMHADLVVLGYGGSCNRVAALEHDAMRWNQLRCGWDEMILFDPNRERSG